ncbi:hypothetical protein NECHADRAFT_85265 [Paecilomyces variotii No. 5]|uniref:NAD-dependent epimerase/dehydratase domain-containing protein n=1 Tax=Byssochlamys spectabilis (strain No. 5 / NBRC 109023) TaxID=1356009 RepID=V5FT92_BYSSN|nr:hypothetical protein NECHADRAFT_85265 [Paecilomyces variotii No. 5]
MARDVEQDSGALSVVTGGTDFIASHIILQLLHAGYTVRATIRASSREKELQSTIRNAGGNVEKLSFFVADLTEDEGWAKAMNGCAFGTLRMLKFAHNAGVKRMVLTSSFAAIGFGHEQIPLFTEKHWSKTLAEKSAWDFMQQEGEALEVAVINPTGVLGPVSFGVVDVRDLADLHIRAMTNPAASGPRFIATCDEGLATMIDISNMLRDSIPDRAQRLPTKGLPNFLVRFVALFVPKLRDIIPELGLSKQITNDKSNSVYGWNYRSIEECIADTAASLVKHGVV